MELQDELRRRIRRRRLLAARRYRSRQFWRRISRGRRTVGMIVLAALLAAAGVAYTFTRPARVKALAETYLTDLSGRTVRIREAHFSPFEGIRLAGVRVLPPEDLAGGYLPDEDEAIFEADEVLLELYPGSLLSGKLRVRRIVALRPALIRIDEEGGRASYERRDPRSPAGLANVRLPEIELREGRFVGRAKQSDGRWRDWLKMAVVMKLWPDPDAPNRYRVRIETGEESAKLTPIEGTLSLDPLVLQTDRPVMIQSTDPMPQWVRKQLDRLDIRGSVSIEFNFDEQAGVSTATLRPKGVAMGLGFVGLEGAKLGDVDGRIVLRRRTVATSAAAATTQPDSGDQVRFEGVFGKLNGTIPFLLDGHYDGFTLDAPFEMKLASPTGGLTLPADPAIYRMLPGRMADLWDYYKPAGRVELAVDLTRPADGGPIDVRGRIRCLDAQLTYWRYPYTLEHVVGEMTFDREQVTLTEMKGRHGEATIEVSGRTGLTGNRPMDLTVRGRDVPVDQDVLDALAAKQSQYIPVIRELNVTTGTADFECRVSRADEPDASIDNELTIQPHDLSVAYEHFPYRVRVLQGRLILVDGGMDLRDLQLAPAHLPGENASAIVMMDGRIRRAAAAGGEDGGEGEGGGGVSVKLDLVCPALPMDEALWAAFPESTRKRLGEFGIGGRARLVGSISRKPGEPLRWDIHAQVSDGRLNYEGFPYPLQAVAGSVHVTPEWIRLADVTAQHAGVPITGGGQVAVSSAEPTRLTIRSDRVPLDRDLFNALPAAAQETWRQFSPAGWVGLDVSLQQQPEPGAEARGRVAQEGPGERKLAVTTTITALGNSIRYSDLPLPLDHVSGQVVVRPDRVDVIELTDEPPGGAGATGRRIKLSGTIWPGRDNMDLPEDARPQPKVQLKLSAENMVFDETLRRAVPWRMRRHWNDLLPTGRFDLFFDDLRYTPLGESSRWDFAGRLDVRGGRVLLGVEFTGLTGQIRGRGALLTDQPIAFVGQADLAEATVAGRSATAVKGRLISDARTGVLRIDSLSGRLHGGTLSGFAQIGAAEATAGEGTPYAIALAVNGMDLAQFVNAHRAAGDRLDVAGRLDGRISLEGRAGRERRGRGEVQLTRARIYQLPPVLAMFNAFNLGRPANPSQSAEVTFFLDGDQIRFEEAVVRDPAVSLLGTGRMNLDDRRLDMTFIAGEPASGARGGVRAIEEFFRGASGELMEYHVTGPYDRPKVEAVPLHSVRDAIEALTMASRRYRESRPANPVPPAQPGGER